MLVYVDEIGMRAVSGDLILGLDLKLLKDQALALSARSTVEKFQA
jgi:hypothetical protein